MSLNVIQQHLILTLVCTGFLLIDKMLTAQEENAAVWGITNQSTTYISENSTLAVDGLATTWSHTKEQTDPWWRLDLRNVYRVNRVTITNRLTSYYYRINGAVIRVGNFPNVYSNPICAVIPTIPSGATDNFSCLGMKGRYVIVHIPGQERILTLAEVEVYVERIGNLGGAATQSSTYKLWSAEKATDGSRGLLEFYTGCSSTLNETNPWWRLDLRHIYKVGKVLVTNRNDSLADQINGAEIRVGNSLENNGSNNPICAVIPDIPAGQSYSYSCSRMEGRYVNLIIPGDMKTLSLCEVEVYGDGPCLKRYLVKMKFSSKAELSDPTVRENLLKQLRSALADRGLADVTLRWSQTPKEETHLKITEDQSCRRNTRFK